MRPVLVRLALAAAGVSVLGVAVQANAAAPGPKSLVITDDAGDTAGLRGDIVKVTYTTTGTKTKTTYTPRNLVLIIETADAIDTSGTTMYEVDADLPGCNSFNLYYTPGVEGSEGSGCGNGSLQDGDSTFVGVDGPPAVGPKTLTFTIPFKSIPGVLKSGATISNIDAYTSVVDPVTGFVGPYIAGFVTDVAPTDKSYKIG